jgi:hypothetical protein
MGKWRCLNGVSKYGCFTGKFELNHEDNYEWKLLCGDYIVKKGIIVGCDNYALHKVEMDMKEADHKARANLLFYILLNFLHKTKNKIIELFE